MRALSLNTPAPNAVDRIGKRRMDEPLKPSRVVAVFPLAVAATPPDPHQADLCRGFGCLLERQLSPISGVDVQLQQLFIAPDSEPGNRGWLITTAPWKTEQMMAFPFPEENGVTHTIHGAAEWQPDTLHLSLELVDVAAHEVLHRETITGEPTEALEEFFTILGRMAFAVVHPLATARQAARVASQPPTKSPEALEHYLVGLAGIQGFRNGMNLPEGPLRALEAALKADPPFPSAALALEELIRECLELGDVAETSALESLERLASTEWSPERLRALLGLRLAETGDAERAVALLEGFVACETRGELASAAMSTLSRMSSRKPAERIRLLHGAVAARPEDASLWEELGFLYLNQKDTIRAETAWRRALEQDPETPGALRGLANLLHEREQFAQASRLAEMALENVFSPDAARIAVDTALRAGELEQADLRATEWAEQLPEAVEPWLVLADVRCRLAEYDAAWYCLERAARLAVSDEHRRAIDLLQLRVKHPRIYKVLEDAQTNLSRPAGRSSLLLSARRLEELATPSGAEEIVWQALAEIYRRLEKTADAIRVQLLLIEKAPEDTERLDVLVQLYRQSGRDSDALLIARRILAMTPNDPTRHELVGDIHLRSGDLSSAIDAYDRAAALPGSGHGVRRKLMNARLRAGADRPPQKVIVDPPPPNGGFLRRMLVWMRRPDA